MQVLVEVGQTSLPERRLVGKTGKVGRVLERLQQTLVVPELVDQLLPVFDHHHVLAGRVSVVGEGKGRSHAPELELAQRLADGDFSLCSTAEGNGWWKGVEDGHESFYDAVDTACDIKVSSVQRLKGHIKGSTHSLSLSHPYNLPFSPSLSSTYPPSLDTCRAP